MAKLPWYLDERRRQQIAQWLTFAFIALVMSAFILLTIRDIWLVEFALTNTGASTVEVTPVGKWHVGGLSGALPQPPESRLALRRPTEDPGTISLAPGETVTIRFDYDDINFTHLLIAAPDDRVLLQPVQHETQRRLKQRYTVKPLEYLREAPPELLPILKGEKVEWTPELTAVPQHSD